MILQFLLKHNLIPYIAIIILGSVIYWQHGRAVERNLVIEQQEATINAVGQTMGIIQSGNEKRLKELESVRQSEWSEGKHEGIF